MSNKGKTIEGVIPAVLTPFDDKGEIDYSLLEKHIDYLCSSGVHGLFLCGTTSEGAYLTAEERKKVFLTAREASKGNLPLYVVFISPHTQQVIREMQDFMKLEPDFVAAVTPFYYSYTQEEIIAHFTSIADATEAPLLLYNIPQNTHNDITPESVQALLSHPNIVGIKDSSGAILPYGNYLAGLVGDNASNFAFIQGADMLDAPSLLLGAPAIVTGLGNVWIEPYMKMYAASRRGDVPSVREEQKQINALAEIIAAADGKVIPAIKSAVASLGRATPRMRMEAATLNTSEQKAVSQTLSSLGLLKS